MLRTAGGGSAEGVCGSCACLLSPSLSSAQKKVSLNTFLDTLMSDPPPQCLVWLPLMHRLANVENGKTTWNIYGGECCGEPPEDATSKYANRSDPRRKLHVCGRPQGPDSRCLIMSTHALSDGRHVNGRVAVTCHMLGFDLCDDHPNRRLK